MRALGLLVILLGNAAFAGTKLEHPAPGTSIVRFTELDANVYKGSKPKNAADYAFLQSKHVKYILNLRFLPLLSRKAKANGMTYVSVYINASPLAPSEKHVTRILELLHDPCYQPIYFHCDIGRDRTSLIATLYRMYFGDLASQDALLEMKDYGFKDSWTLLGLKKYLLKHPKPPASLASISHTCRAASSQSVGEISRRP